MSEINGDGERDRKEEFDRRQAAKYGMVAALLGAIVGGLASFSATFVTLQMQADLDAIAVKRTAFAAYIADVEEYLNQMGTLVKASDSQAGFERESEVLRAAQSDISVSSMGVYLVGDDRVVQTQQALTDVLFEAKVPDAPEDVDDAALSSLLDTIEAAQEAMGHFLIAAKEDVADE